MGWEGRCGVGGEVWGGRGGVGWEGRCGMGGEMWGGKGRGGMGRGVDEDVLQVHETTRCGDNIQGTTA